MRTLLFPFFGLLLFISCSKERQTLNQIEGTFETVEFVVTASDTDSILFTASPTLHFGECAPRDTRCLMTVVDSDSTIYMYRFEYNYDPVSGIEQINFNPADAQTAGIDSRLGEAMDNVFDFELNNDELRLYSEDRSWRRPQDSLLRFDLCDISITAVKR